MIERVTKMRERVKAWEECETCKGLDQEDADSCPGCGGNRGKWHEAVQMRYGPAGEEEPLLKVFWQPPGCNKHVFLVPITKSSTLIRYHKMCRVCKGNKVVGSPDFLGDKVENMTICTMNVCPNCQGTGCEPGTATDWMVK